MHEFDMHDSFPMLFKVKPVTACYTCPSNVLELISVWFSLFSIQSISDSISGVNSYSIGPFSFIDMLLCFDTQCQWYVNNSK